ncbi:flagellar hook-associated protein FlgK [Chromobacterium haemolyticum]|uniref:flagellar hook-associated protein FlgK n=1 Tax=Chromobacterium haemolyticum TaxID=394935 RepID=UPI0009DB660A|nr:flagellar hook-associated protein FlgK [Chromobacterium haemolyticum]OQS33858.1 flagellar hook-associated protein FlgK [Chromobacterium haemolyticum]
MFSNHITLSGIAAAKNGVYITQLNMANLKTVGYARRDVVFSSLSYGGVASSGVLRISNNYINQRLWDAASKLQQFDSVGAYYNELQGSEVSNYAKAGGGLGMKDFFAALSKASTDPGKPELRSSVLDAAANMVRAFNGRTDTLNSQLNTVQQDRSSTIEDINSLAGHMAEVNKQILSMPDGAGEGRAALFDERDNLMKQLAAASGGQATIMANGTVNVSLKGGQPLVVGAKAYEMKVTKGKDGQQEISIVSGRQEFQVPRNDLGGKLKGLDDYEHDTLRPHMRAHQQLIKETAERYNAQHKKGFDQAGNPGKDLFKLDANTGRIELEALKPEELAFSGKAGSGVEGNSDNLNLLIKVKDQDIELEGMGKSSLEGGLALMMNKVGTAAKGNKDAIAMEEARYETVYSSWQQTSGISDDYEAGSLFQYQQMMNSNIKVLEVCRNIFNTMLNAM